MVTDITEITLIITLSPITEIVKNQSRSIEYIYTRSTKPINTEITNKE